MDWPSITLTLVTCATTLLGVGVSHFKPEERRAKVLLFSLAIVLTAAQSGEQIWMQQQASAKVQEEKAKRADIRRNLAVYISSANIIMAKLVDAKDNSGFAEADAWYQAALKYVGDVLGENYLARFNDNTNLPSAYPSVIGGDENRLGYWRGIYNRDARLVQFSAEFSP